MGVELGRDSKSGSKLTVIREIVEGPSGSGNIR